MARVNGTRAATQADRVYSALRERLLRGDMPVGRRLVEQQLGGRLRDVEDAGARGPTAPGG